LDHRDSLKAAKNTKAATFSGSGSRFLLMCNLLFLHSQHTTRFAATCIEVAVNKYEAKSVGVHAGGIVV
jgi:hypothetical protein